MRSSRAIREGSVGLLILAGLVLFAGLILWIRGVGLGNRSYRIVFIFANAAGMQVGTPVRYRGVPVGKVVDTRPGPNGVEVEVEVAPADLVIPKNVTVEANQSGLIGSSSIDITPVEQLSGPIGTKPLDKDCNRDLIICNDAKLPGRVGVSVDELIRASIRFASVYSDPEFLAGINAVTKNSAEAAAEVARLSREFNVLTRSVRSQVGTFSDSAGALTLTATKFGLTADQINSLLTVNRSSLVSTLDNINLLTRDLRTSVNGLSPIVGRVQQGELLQNLEVLSRNAAEASANLRDASRSLNTPGNLVLLQQTLESARATFQNAQKITADLDELTGDPTFRRQLRQLVNDLSGLVSSTQQLQQQTQVAQTLSPLATKAESPTPPEASATPLSAGSKAHENAAPPKKVPAPAE